jgi:tRNA(Arg) A34 adenosine deaminase TadA
VSDAELMERALAQARLALEEGAMPIGAVLACNGDVLAEAHWNGLEYGVTGAESEFARRTLA